MKKILLLKKNIRKIVGKNEDFTIQEYNSDYKTIIINGELKNIDQNKYDEKYIILVTYGVPHYKKARNLYIESNDEFISIGVKNVKRL